MASGVPAYIIYSMPQQHNVGCAAPSIMPPAPAAPELNNSESNLMTGPILNYHKKNSPNNPRRSDEGEEVGKMFVGGLSWDTGQDALFRYFSNFGAVIDCVVMKNTETGRSRGFGFVTYSDPSNIDVVLSSVPHVLDGRTIDPKACNPRSMQKLARRNTGYPKIFLGGLPSSITEIDLRNFFSQFGDVCEVVIIFDQEKKKSRGFGFLSFKDEAAVIRTVREHFVIIQNKKVEIKRAEPRSFTSGAPILDKNQYRSPTSCGWLAPPIACSNQTSAVIGYSNYPSSNLWAPSASPYVTPTSASTASLLSHHYSSSVITPQPAVYGSWGNVITPTPNMMPTTDPAAYGVPPQQIVTVNPSTKLDTNSPQDYSLAPYKAANPGTFINKHVQVVHSPPYEIPPNPLVISHVAPPTSQVGYIVASPPNILGDRNSAATAMYGTFQGGYHSYHRS